LESVLSLESGNCEAGELAQSGSARGRRTRTSYSINFISLLLLWRASCLADSQSFASRKIQNRRPVECEAKLQLPLNF
jgi:hypothetical protein